MVRLVVQTQYMEYYGDDSTDVNDNGRWKFKGGGEYVLATMSIGQCALGNDHLQSIIDAKRSLVEYSNPMTQEYITDWELVFGGDLTRGEKYAEDLIKNFGANREEVENLYHPKVLEAA